MTKKPIVRLISWTPQPLELMLYVFKIMTGVVPDFFGKFVADLHQMWTPNFKREFMKYLAYESLAGGIQEFIGTAWYLGNVSRAFQQQLTRHRHAGYCIQSMRIQSKKDFAETGSFHMPSDVKNPEFFEYVMNEIEGKYNMLLERGESNQVARGVLPLNIHSPITFNINLRSIRDLICVRLCELVQGEFKDIAFMMVDEISKKMGAEFGALFDKPCGLLGFCPHAEGCGEVEPKEKGIMSKGLKDFIES